MLYVNNWNDFVLNMNTKRETDNVIKQIFVFLFSTKESSSQHRSLNESPDNTSLLKSFRYVTENQL